jgi:gas vesicle protein
MATSTDQLSAEDLRRQLDEQRADIGNDLVAIGDRVSPKRMTERRTAAVKNKLSGARDAVMGAKDSVADKASEVTGQAGDAASGAADQLRHGPEVVKQQTQGNPLAAGLVAFGGGLLVATLIPPSRREQQLVHERVQPQLEEAASHVGEVAQGAVEEIKPAAQEAVSDLKDEAQQAVSEVKDEASSAAGEVADDAKQEASELRH